MTPSNSTIPDAMRPSGFRAEIQALRAIAVLVVLLFHIWPQLLPGGYVGVDVFFVISGYLITGILFKEFEATGRISVRDFYVRRIRRLLPAATVVLLAIAFVMPLLPQTRWPDTVQGIIASTLYVQNWWLAQQAVDYLAAESEPSMLTHFWSLSVEEQYYIFWPLLLMLVGLLPADWRSRPGRLFASLVMAVVAASLAYSVWLTWHNPPQAYFSTFTRAWELGVGGVLAVTVRWRAIGQGMRDVFGWLGIAMIAAAVLTYDKSTPFPGYAAALPVLGAALVIAARDSNSRASSYVLLKTRVFQYFGDISYSLYLWHWPVLIVYGALTGRSPDLVDGIIIFAVSCALAHQSKTLVEDAFRHPKGAKEHTWKPFFLAAACILLSLGAAWASQRPWRTADEVGTQVAADAAPTVSSHPGAAALTEGLDAGDGASPLPAPTTAKDDLPAPYRDRCLSRGSNKSVKVCEYGERKADFKILLVGDTYAAQWQPALEEVAQANGWRLSIIAKTGCALGDVSPANNDGTVFAACESWREEMARKADKMKPDLLLVAQSPSARVMGHADGKATVEALSKGLAAFASARVRAGTPVAFLRSTPSMGNDCRDPATMVSCQRLRKRALVNQDPVLLAASLVGGAPVIDLSDAICRADTCPAVVGNVVVYRGAAHLTATYARTLAPAMARVLGALKTVELGDVSVPVVKALPPPSDLPGRAMAAKRDNPDLYRDGCHVDQVSSEPKSCIYGAADAPVKIVLTGDSHAAQWLPPLQVLAKKEGWALYSFTKSACAFSDTVVQSGGREYTSCTEWNRKLMDRIARLKPDLVVTSQSRGQRANGASDVAQSQAMLADGLVSRWRKLRGMGIGVLVIADTPWMKRDIPDCLSAPRVVPGACDTDLKDAVKSPDSILAAMKQSPDVAFLSFNDRICTGGVCPAMQGDAVIWRDRHHLTASFTRGFAGPIDSAAKAAMKH